jgi:5-methylcytosine-specific restriction protein A
MVMVILGWNPDMWNWDGMYPAAVAEVRESGRNLERWSIADGKYLPVGAEVWLLVQGGKPNQRGLIGHGITISEPFSGEPNDPDTGGTRRYIDVEFDLLLPEGEQLRTDELTARIPDVGWTTSLRSGWRIPPGAEAAVRANWAEHVGDNSAAGEVDSLEPTPGTYPESALARLAVNRYERSAEAHALAIAHHGSSCHACSFDFEVTYGPQGAGFIHVHHTVPFSQIGPRYELDPITDLVPLCPNCHHMIHRRRPVPHTVAELRAMISAAGHLPGVIVTSEQQQAQDAARKIAEAGSMNATNSSQSGPLP